MPWTMDVCLWCPYVDALGSTTRSFTPPRGFRDDGTWDRGGACWAARSGRWSFSMDDSREWATLRAPRATGRIVFCQSSSSSSSSSRETVRGENFRGSWSGNVVWDGAVVVSTALSAMHVDWTVGWTVDCVGHPETSCSPSRHGRQEPRPRTACAEPKQDETNTETTARGDGSQQPALTMLRGRLVRSLQQDLQFATRAGQGGRQGKSRK